MILGWLGSLLACEGNGNDVPTVERIGGGSDCTHASALPDGRAVAACGGIFYLEENGVLVERPEVVPEGLAAGAFARAPDGTPWLGLYTGDGSRAGVARWSGSAWELGVLVPDGVQTLINDQLVVGEGEAWYAVGGVWRIDLETGEAGPFLPDATSTGLGLDDEGVLYGANVLNQGWSAAPGAQPSFWADCDAGVSDYCSGWGGGYGGPQMLQRGGDGAVWFWTGTDSDSRYWRMARGEAVNVADKDAVNSNLRSFVVDDEGVLWAAEGVLRRYDPSATEPAWEDVASLDDPDAHLSLGLDDHTVMIYSRASAYGSVVHRVVR